MNIHDVIANLFATNCSQISAYQADINNLLAMLNSLQLQQQAITIWLSQNPE